MFQVSARASELSQIAQNQRLIHQAHRVARGLSQCLVGPIQRCLMRTDGTQGGCHSGHIPRRDGLKLGILTRPVNQSVAQREGLETEREFQRQTRRAVMPRCQTLRSIVCVPVPAVQQMQPDLMKTGLEGRRLATTPCVQRPRGSRVVPIPCLLTESASILISIHPTSLAQTLALSHAVHP